MPSKTGTLTASNAKIPLKPKTLFYRKDGKAVFNGVAYHTPLTLLDKTLDVVVDTHWEDTWFSCRVVSGLGCDIACPKKYDGTDFDPFGCYTEANATFQLGNATFTDTAVGFARGKFDNGVSKHQGSLGVDGVIGLGYIHDYVSWNTYEAVKQQGVELQRYLDSFSVSLESGAEFVMLNGVDKALIAEKKLSARSFSMSARDVKMTAFHVEGLAGEPLYPCIARTYYNGEQAGCEADLTSENSHLGMPSWIFDEFEIKYLAATSTGCSKTVNTDEVLIGKNRLYECPSTVKLPRLGVTFGNTTFYLDSKDYTTPIPDDASKVIVNVVGGEVDFIVGLAFQKKFYLSYVPEDLVTVYCKDGEDCKVDAVTNPAVPSSSWKYKEYHSYAGSYFGNPVNNTDTSKKSGSGATEEDPLLKIIKDSETTSRVIWVMAIVIAVIVSAVSAFRVITHKKKSAAAAEAKLADEDAALATPSASTPSNSLHPHEAAPTPTAAAQQA